MLNRAPRAADNTGVERADLERLLRVLVESDGSDLHVKAGSPPKIRVYGELIAVEGEPTLTADTAAELVAVGLPDEASHRLETAGEADFALSMPGLGRFRVNVFRQRGSMAMAVRRVRSEVPTFEELGLPDVINRLSDEPRGLILVTGPTGSGKTTTLAAMVDRINRTRSCHIITIEDPVEFLHSDRRASVNQREIGLDTMDFPSAMRAAMRQDPDVILVGEMRDEETVRAALSAAETGHLVLSTLHTIDATETVNRIVDFFPPYQQTQIRLALAGSLRGVICQRLVPRMGGMGRVAALEVLVANGRVAQSIINPGRGADITEIIREGEYYGMQTFDQALARLYADGKIGLRDALAAASNPHDLKVTLARSGLVTAAEAAG
ncbi:MAG TPA: type IV pilus twitching motility protein PilT [Acidimicrobiales bacterium]|nr:type IV pilus twitching motility protein PilT [Acidimicrobiales bacterium]